jgi:hypothetical protein
VLNVAIEVPEALRLDLILRLLKVLAHPLHLGGREVLGELRGELLVALQDSTLCGDAVLDVAANVLGGIQLWLLGQQPGAEALREPGIADVFGVDAGHDPKERRLPCPIRAQDTDLGIGIEGQGDAAEDLPLRRHDLFQLIHLVDELRGHLNTITR